jgi:outer membrane protein assembly factor BamB
MKLEKEGDKFVAKELWSNTDKGVQFNTPVLKNGMLYGLTQGNELFCINAKDGKTAWSAPFPGSNTGELAAGERPRGERPAGERREGERPGGERPPGDRPPGDRPPGGPPGGGRGMGRGGAGGYGSIVDAGSVLLALTPAGQLIVFAPSDKEFKQLASYKVSETQTHAYPVASGNRIFIKDKDSVVLWTID